MQISDNKYVELDYTLTLESSGEVVDRSEKGDPLAFIVGTGRIIPGLEKQLLGLEKGASAKLLVEAEEAYGEKDENLLQTLPRDAFPDALELAVGLELNVRGPHGPTRLKVTEVRDDEVVVDLNHPLAGERLCFDVRIAEVREPTQEEQDDLGGGGGCSESSCGSCSCSGGGCGG